ncbi:adenylate/guanylate cyclase domain-containing protein [Sinosporangium siamense]|uniref:Guanylate cyclase domain-containing protein n=1 Tax=Sinosporangium siamense TaxID=1367973 RepID=A0A919V8K8_9ACTN|nr:adenylate/guanylate cyclase domain-containing protein [Sinosporangium siamense]GII96240.1 hypothetical protein Ssi02_64710 [Sinosporangium siamense]
MTRSGTVDEASGREPYLPPATHPVRVFVWLIHLAAPMLGLWLLLAYPTQLNIKWEHNHGHFWLILLIAAVNVVLGLMISQAAASRGDARLLLVSLLFLSSAGFFVLHALSTPKIILPGGNVGFDLAQPVGMTIASVFAFISALPLRARAARLVLKLQMPLRAGLVLVLVGWGVASLVPGLTPLSAKPTEAGAGLGVYSLGAVVLFAGASLLMYLLYRRRPSTMLISLVTAYALLAEAMIAGMSQRNWALSWWEWHLLLLFAFMFVAYSAHIQFRREGGSSGLFDSVALSETVRRIQAEYGRVLEELVDHIRQRSTTDGLPTALRLAGKFGLTEGQAAVLDRAGLALANERELSDRLSALVAVGRDSRVGLPESDLINATLDRVRKAYGDVRIGLMVDGAIVPGPFGLRMPYELDNLPLYLDGVVVHPLTVKDRLAGVLEVPVGRTPHDEALAETLAGQVSISLENGRLYQELGTLFRQYMSPDVAASLLADPAQAALGGSLVELTALFADLKGFTTFSERVPPEEIVEMLNRYHTAAVPCILDNGGTIVQFIGDALLALFNAPARQPHHAEAAARAALAMQAAAKRVAAEVAAEQRAGLMRRVEWPRWRVGINTGPALVGNIGSPELRGFNAMGDCVNVAARLQTLAEPGTVVIGADTRNMIGPGATVWSLGDLHLKGKKHPVHAYVLTRLA